MPKKRERTGSITSEGGRQKRSNSESQRQIGWRGKAGLGAKNIIEEKSGGLGDLGEGGG